MAGVRRIAVTNQKGGVGKTTTTANLAAALAQRGCNVCLVDLDPQAHLTMHFGIDTRSLSASMYDVMTADVPLTRAAVLIEPNLTVVPSTIDLAAAEVELAGEVGREQVLHDRLTTEGLPYDVVMIDCAPSLGLLTLNALAATEEVLIPMQPHFLALQGLGRLLETVALVQRRINPRLKVAGVVFCMYESGTRLAGEVIADVQEFFQAARVSRTPWSRTRIFDTRIRRNVKLAECPSHGTTILHYDRSSHGAQDYSALAEEFLGARDARQANGPATAAAPVGPTDTVTADAPAGSPVRAVEPDSASQPPDADPPAGHEPHMQ